MKPYVKKWALTLTSVVDELSADSLPAGVHLRFMSERITLASLVDFESELDRKLTEEEFDTIAAQLKFKYFSKQKEEINFD